MVVVQVHGAMLIKPDCYASQRYLNATQLSGCLPVYIFLPCIHTHILNPLVRIYERMGDCIVDYGFDLSTHHMLRMLDLMMM